MPSEFIVMTHNTGNGLARPADLVRVLAQSEADLIGLQEVTALQKAHIERELGDKYPHMVLFGEGIPGKGVLSKFPLRDVERLRIYPDRPDLRVTVEIEGREVCLIVGHPPPPRIRRTGFHMDRQTTEHVKQLVSLAAQGPPAILLGDFNLTEQNTLYSHIKEAGLLDAFRSAGEGAGLTLPTRYFRVRLRPMLRVDYVWHTPHLKAYRAWVGENSGSDHLPVLARMSWEEGGGLSVDDRR